MGDITAAASGWRKGGATMTLEEYRRQGTHVPRPALRGTPIDAGAERPEPQPDWRERARCRLEGKPTSWFFPDAGDQTTVRIVRFCAGCDVRAECRQWAIDQSLWVGWYGGESPKQRAGTANRWSGPDRAHGTTARAKFGARGWERGNGCLCRPCSDAWAESKQKETERIRRKNQAQREKQRAFREAVRGSNGA